MTSFSNRPALGDLTNALPNASLATPSKHIITKRPQLKLPSFPPSPETPHTPMQITPAKPDNHLADEETLFHASSIVTQPTPRTEPPVAQTPPQQARPSKPTKFVWNKPTKPKSPNFRLTTHFSKPKTLPTPKPTSKKRAAPVHQSHITHPKSPKLRCVPKAPSAQIAALKDAKARAHKAELAHQARLKARQQKARQNWLRGRTIPKSPAFRRQPRALPRPEPVPARFVPLPRPAFLDHSAPIVRPTLASIARAGAKAMPPRKKKTAKPNRAFVRPKQTVPAPFPLQSVPMHNEKIVRQRAQQLHDEELVRRKRAFQPTPFCPSILEAPQFVPQRSEIPLTRPESLLPLAEERMRRTRAFQARQRERVEELEREGEIAKKELELREERLVQARYRQNRFRPRLVPSSHYRPQMVRQGYAGSEYGEDGVSEYATNSVRGEENEGFPAVERKGSIFDGLRRSLEPLLGITSPPPAEEM